MSKYQNKKTKDGKENPAYVDMLDEDKPIANQKFVCMSFVSPEKILKKKEAFMFEEFVKSWDLRKSLEKYSQFLNFLSYKYDIKQEDLNKDLEEFVKEESINIGKTSITDEYKTFLDNNEEKLENKFGIEHDFQTSVNGVKVRGTFPTQEEAEFRAKKLREVDPNFDVYVGPVGVWMPWEPEAYKTGRVEYLEDELNQIMHKKQENEDKAKDYFESRVKEAKVKAIEENKKLAKESGNKLTQNITPEGNLVGVANMNTQEENIKIESGTSAAGTSAAGTSAAGTSAAGTSAAGTSTSADIKKELFEGDNIVTSLNTDRGLSSLQDGLTFTLGSGQGAEESKSGNDADMSPEEKAFLDSIKNPSD